MMIRTMDMQDRNFDGIDDRDQQEPMAYGQAITQGPGGQMYTDRSMQNPYNPPIRGQATGFDGNPIRNFGPQRGIGSFPNPFGGFMGGGRGNFMRPQPPMYGGGYGMQPPMFGGGMGYGMPPMFGGGMYGGGFGMQPPMFGGGYGGGFGSPFGQSFYGGIGGMFPGMGGGYGMQRPPSYGGFGGGFNRPMPQPIRPSPIRPVQIGRPNPIRPIGPHPALRIKKPMPVRPSIDSLRPARPIQMLREENKGPESLMRQDRIRPANYYTDRRFGERKLRPF